jgi:Cell division protein FtsI/penicillin-binding protein 2
VVEYDAKAAYAIVMNPKTGEVLSMAHYPTFNPNVFNTYKPSRWRNKAVTDTFEPGSTMKVFIAAAALESGLCEPNSIFYCENGAYNIGPIMQYFWGKKQQIVIQMHQHIKVSMTYVLKPCRIANKNISIEIP